MLKFEMYKKLLAEKGEIFAKAKKAASEIGIGPDLAGKFGLTGAISGMPAPLRDDIMEATEKGAKEVLPLAGLVDEIRTLVKGYYGDEFDVVSTPTCEAGLWLAFDVLVSPPYTGRGDNYRSRYIALYEKHLHHQGSYGRPFPAHYKDFIAERGSTPGELGFNGKRQYNTDVILAKLEGANYEPHGIKYHPSLQLTNVDVDASMKKISKLAERHAAYLNGLTSLGYDTPGYGYGDKDEEGTPRLQKLMGELAREYDVPYIVDNAWGLPFVGVDIRKNNADLMIYSMDKATGAPTSGMIIGREEYIVPLRRALGVHGERWGTTGSYGKASHVIFDPGKEALLGQVAALKALQEKPELYKKPVEQTYDIVMEELQALPEKIRKNIVVSKSFNSGTVEINYEATWNGEEPGFPIFTIEDMYGSSNLLQSGLKEMGIIPTIAYDGNIFISPGQNTTDDKGNLIEERMRLAIKGLVRLMEIIGQHAGIM